MRFEKQIAAANPVLDWWETDRLLVNLLAVDVRHVLEIGTHLGGSARLWRDVLGPELLITVDWHGDFLGDQTGIEVVVGRPSQDEIVYETVRSILSGRGLDFLFIDGGHRYLEAFTDWKIYGAMVRRGGLVVFHDVHAPVTNEMEVPLLWEGLVNDPTLHTAEIWNEAGRGTGFGLVWK